MTYTDVVNEVMNDDFGVGGDVQDNAIEFLRNAKTAVVTFSQGKYISKIRKLAQEKPNECKIKVENADGSIVATIPTKWIKISPPRVATEEQIERARELGKRMSELRKQNVSKNA